MKLRSLGYVGQNLATGLTTGRTLRLANLSEQRVAEVAEKNLQDLRAILEWNVRHDILCFRIGSSVIPFASHPGFTLDWSARFERELEGIRRYAAKHRLRLSMHPGQYTVLNSPSDRVVANSIVELEYHARFLSLVAPEDGTMTLHVGGAYGDREAALERFAVNFERLSERARSRLVLENDDTTFDAEAVIGLAGVIRCPVVFDFFHHRCLRPVDDWRRGLPELVERVVATWRGMTPKFHLSSPRAAGITAHADYIAPDDLITTLRIMEEVGGDDRFDLMLEAKAKDAAVLEAMAGLTPY
ncbi:MAG TPA: UV DNA damage repair endonuclease UvsE [Trueperaceae bacterium]